MICHTGGAEGSDITWETTGLQYGITVISYSFNGHKQLSNNRKILTNNELIEGFNHVQYANNTLKRNLFNISPYIKNLLSRNWYQVKNSNSIFAIGEFTNSKHNSVKGGTGWAVQMAIDNEKDIYFLNQYEDFSENKNEFFHITDYKWYKFDYKNSKFLKINYIPKLTDNFAGIGTRQINSIGINAIIDIYKNTFNSGV